MTLELNLDFTRVFSEDKFFFGVANAPYLCEGGFNSPDGIKNSYAVLELNGVMEPSGEAVRFWTDYEEQIEIAASLGLNAFRMGIEWSRIQPSTAMERRDPPPWDDSAVAHYAEIVASVIRHDLQPIITLHHFTHPGWLGLEMWLGEEGPDLLADYQLRVVEEVNERLLESTGSVMKHFVVYNELNLVPLIYHWGDTFPNPSKGPQYLVQGYDAMLSRYVRVYDGLYDLFERRGWGTPHVGFGIASLCTYELDKLFYDLVRVRSFGIERSEVDNKLGEHKRAWEARIGELAKSKLTDAQHERYLSMKQVTEQAFKPSLMTKTLEAIYRSPREKKLDYLSANIYEPFNPAKRTNGTVEWWDYGADVEVYGTFIRAYNDFNSDLPVYMGENSLAYKQPIGQEAEPRPDGWTRERYLKTYLMEMVRCMKEGVPIQGYLYWSLVDDFEWDAGYAPRLGLYNYDYVKHRINETDGLGEPAGRIYAHLIGALRSGDKEKIATAFTKGFVR